MRANYPSNRTLAEWEALQRHLPLLPRRGRPPTHSLRSIFDAIFYVLRDFLPPLATYQPISRRGKPYAITFVACAIPGIWFRLLTALREAERERVGRNRQPSAAIMDAETHQDC